MYQNLDPTRTTWHITWGTYGTRLHGGVRPTVDKDQNKFGEEFIGRDPNREDRARMQMVAEALYLSVSQREFVEAELPRICNRGGWSYRVCAAGPDHVHLLCDILPEIHGEKVRRLVKRWLGQALSLRWPLEEHPRWWADEGSNKAVKDEKYLNSAFAYVPKQRTTPFESQSK
jgi:hypothetical protein